MGMSDSKFNIQFFADFEVLNNEFVALYLKEDNKSKILISPQNPKNPKIYSFKEAVQDLENFGVDSKKLKTNIQSFLGAEKEKEFNECTVTLTTLFLYIPDVSQDTKEYAFAIELHLGDFGNVGPLKLKTVKFAIWNTTKTAVIESMRLKTIEVLLKELNDSSVRQLN